MDQFGFGNGMGDGQGSGDRPEQETDTDYYESKVGAKPKKGEAVRIGSAKGPNRAGRSLEGSREEILSSIKNEEDPLQNQRLPKDQENHVREYNAKFHEG